MVMRRRRKNQRGATVVFGVIGAAIGAAVDPANPMQGAQWGWAIGTVVGGLLFPTKMPATSAGKLDDLRVTSSTEGAFIPQVWGQFRFGCQVIWSNDLKESTSQSGGGGKGGGGGGQVTTYNYSTSFAALVCRGPVESVDRIWFNDTIVYDRNATPTTEGGITIEGIYLGTETQTEDPLMSAALSVQGIPCPGYRGYCYIVLQDLPLANYGNRLPNIQVEVTAFGSSAKDILVDVAMQCGLEPPVVDMTLAGTSSANGHYAFYTNHDIDYSLVYSNGSCLLEWDKTSLHWRIIASMGAGSVLYTASGTRSEVPTTGWTHSAGSLPVPNVAITNIDFDFSLATDVISTTAGDIIHGYCNPVRQIGKAALEPLALYLGADIVETDGMIRWVPRGAVPCRMLTEEDLGCVEWAIDGNSDGTDGDQKALFQYKRQQAWELPTQVDVKYYQWSSVQSQRNYLNASQSTLRHTKLDRQNASDISLPMAIEDTFARQFTERVLYTAWIEAETYTAVLGIRNSDLVPSDIVLIQHAGTLRRLRIISKDEGLPGLSETTFVRDEWAVLRNYIGGQATGGTGLPFTGGGTAQAFVFQANALNDTIAKEGKLHVYLGAVWDAGRTTAGIGCDIYISTDTGASYTLAQSKASATVMGVCQNVLPTWTAYGTTDTTSHLDVYLQRGAFASCSSADLANGANALFVGGEIIQFQTASYLGANVYRLTTLKRGQRGTDAFMSTHGGSEVAVTINSQLGIWTTIPSPYGAGPTVGQQIDVKFVFKGETLAGVSPVTFNLDQPEWMPYSVGSASGSRNMGGDITITYAPRSRWAGSPPSDNSPYSFEIEVWDATYTTLVRTISSSSGTTAAYSSVDQVTDFGSNQATVYLRIYQLNSLVGRGYKWEGSM